MPVVDAFCAQYGNVHVVTELEIIWNKGKISTMCINNFKLLHTLARKDVKNYGSVGATKWQTILLKLHRMEIMVQ